MSHLAINTAVSTFFHRRLSTLTIFLTRLNPGDSLTTLTNYIPSSRLTSGIFFRHSVATPLSSLLLNLELLQSHLEKLPVANFPTHLLQQSLSQAHYLHDLVKSSSTTRQAKRYYFPVKLALEAVILRLHRPWCRQHLHAHLHLPADLTLRGHSFYLQEALSCLIVNAFEAYQSRQSQTVALTVYRRGQQLIIHINDTGQGMNWWTQRRHFVEGFSTKKRNSGMGLALVKEVIEKQYLGKLIVYSSPGNGTSLTILLPIR